MVNLKFWKKDKEDNFEDFDNFDRSRGGGFGPASQGQPMQNNGFPQQSNNEMDLPGVPASNPSPQPNMAGGQLDVVKKDIEVLNSKIDSLKSNLEAINQKLNNIESRLSNPIDAEQKRSDSWHY